MNNLFLLSLFSFFSISCVGKINKRVEDFASETEITEPSTEAPIVNYPSAPPVAPPPPPISPAKNISVRVNINQMKKDKRKNLLKKEATLSQELEKIRDLKRLTLIDKKELESKKRALELSLKEKEKFLKSNQANVINDYLKANNSCSLKEQKIKKAEILVDIISNEIQNLQDHLNSHAHDSLDYTSDQFPGVVSYSDIEETIGELEKKLIINETIHQEMVACGLLLHKEELRLANLSINFNQQVITAKAFVEVMNEDKKRLNLLIQELKSKEQLVKDLSLNLRESEKSLNFVRERLSKATDEEIKVTAISNDSEDPKDEMMKFLKAKLAAKFKQKNREEYLQNFDLE